MKAPVFGLDGEVKKNIRLPKVFETPFRPDLINRVFWAMFTHSLQPKGTDPLAGERTSARSWGVGHGVSRIARVKGERHPRAGMAAGVAGVVKGRAAHPPKAEKVIYKRVNKKERWLATASAIAASASKELVLKRGHRVEDVQIPLIVSKELEEVRRTKDLIEVLKRLGLEKELERAKEGTKRRSGKPRMRGRVKKEPKSILLVVKEDKGIGKAAKNLPGVDVVLAKDLSVVHLAPGGHAGRLVIWSEPSLKCISKNVISSSLRILGKA